VQVDNAGKGFEACPWGNLPPNELVLLPESTDT